MACFTRRIALLPMLAGPAATLSNLASVAAPVPATPYKNPNRDCCNRCALYLNRNGLDVATIDTDLVRVQQEHGVPRELAGCHGHHAARHAAGRTGHGRAGHEQTGAVRSSCPCPGRALLHLRAGVEP